MEDNAQRRDFSLLDQPRLPYVFSRDMLLQLFTWQHSEILI